MILIFHSHTYGYLNNRQLYSIKTVRDMGLKRQEKDLTFAQWSTLIKDIALSHLNIWKIGGD